MKNSKRRQGSFLTLLIRNYLFFTLGTGAIIVLACFLFIFLSDYACHLPRIERLAGDEERLRNEEYENLKAEDLLGTDGYFQVLDGKRNIIFNGREGEKEGYTKGELECIRDYHTDTYIEITEYKNKSGESSTLIQYQSFRGDKDTNDIAYLILDKNRTIIQSNYQWKRKSYTKREFEFLSGTYSKEYDVEKHNFKNKQGDNRTLLMFTKFPDEAATGRADRIMSFLLPAILASYIIMTLLFVYWMNRKVKQPLAIINGAMGALARGEHRLIGAYRGPREFMKICESYNRMAQLLQESELEKEQLEKEKRKILADISHDLKTPITVIQGYAKAVHDGVAGEDNIKMYLDTIYKKSEALTEQINAFYDYNKLEHPEYQLYLEEKNICEYVREYLANKYEEISRAGFELIAEVPEEDIRCSIDVVQLKRVFENIVENSLKHNAPGTKVAFYVEMLGDCVSLRIGDSGGGIAKELIPSLFDPFTVGDESRTNRQGSGLGLAIARKIIETHHGGIQLMEQPKAGLSTEFEIKLPILFT